jgi:hypothetical protein
MFNWILGGIFALFVVGVVRACFEKDSLKTQRSEGEWNPEQTL